MNALENELNLFKKILDTLPNCIYLKDLNGRYVWLNQASIRQLQFKHSLVDSIIGKTDFEIFPKENAQEYAKNDKIVIETKKGMVVEEEVLLSTGDKLMQLSFKEPLYNADQSQLLGILGYTIDITERKLAEKREREAVANTATQTAIAETEAELRQAVTILTGSIAHDIRAPLGCVAMSAGFLLDELPILLEAYTLAVKANLSLSKVINEDSMDRLAQADTRIRRAVKDMEEFINATLKTLKVGLKKEVGKDDLLRCSMWHCLHNTIFRYPFLPEQKKLVTWDQKDFAFMGNEVMMTRVFTNLLKNSLEQITKNGKGEIFILTEKGNDVNIIHFKDTAGGAPPEIVEQIFGGFKTTKAQGTGVGLAFCYLTLKNFGGTITCHSVENDFIEFTITLPNPGDK